MVDRGYSWPPPAPHGVAVVQKFGENQEITTASDPEDVWIAGGLYAFPSAAAATTVVGGAQDIVTTGTGAWTVTVQGLDANWLLAEETVTMNGGTPVTCSTQYIRVFRAFVATAGTDVTNNADVDIKHGATVLARIGAAQGQTLQAIYTVPDDYGGAYLKAWEASVGKSAAAAYARFSLIQRPFGGAWRVLSTHYVTTTGSTHLLRRYDGPPGRGGVEPYLAPKTDILVRVTEVSATLSVSAGFDLVMYKKS